MLAPLSDLVGECGETKTTRKNKVNSLPAIDAHERQRFNDLHGTVVSSRIFIRSQSLIAR